jgi:ribosomal-protein-alanine N-acetyltransferase
MNLFYKSDRLLIKIRNERSAAQVLRFYQSGRECFEQVEPARPADFYTLSFQEKLLRAEFKETMRGKSVRFFLSPLEQPDLIIGTISFYHIISAPFFSCTTGYKIDPLWQNKGYASEALSRTIEITSQHFHLHRIEAYVLPDNYASLRLLEKCQFHPEGVAYEYTLLNGEWKDHLRYCYLCPDSL